jgi:hypothetical protein
VIPVVSDLEREDAMGAKGLPIREDVPAAELRRLSVREADRAKARWMMAIANALEGMSRAEAARLAGMERQALRDAVVRYNEEGLAGLSERRRPGPRPRQDEARCATLCWPVRRWSGPG